MMLRAIAIQLATLSLALSGICLILSGVHRPLQQTAGKLLAVGIVLAASAAIIPFG